MSETSCRGSAQGDDLLGVTTGRSLTKSLFLAFLLAPAPRGRFALKNLIRSGASKRFVLTGSVALRFPMTVSPSQGIGHKRRACEVKFFKRPAALSRPKLDTTMQKPNEPSGMA
jgi:hypothetical protein